MLLISLSRSNAEIQKIIAFENAFEKLLSIILQEGVTDGGIVVQDCLQLTHNLLRYNVSNQVNIIYIYFFYLFYTNDKLKIKIVNISCRFCY